MENQKQTLMEQRKDFLIKFCYWGVVILCAYAALRYLLPVLFPFVLAFGIAYLLDKPIRRIAKESKWKRSVFSVLFSLAFFILAGGIISWCGIWIFSGMRQAVLALPAVFENFIFPFLEEGAAWIEDLFRMADPASLEFLDNSFESILRALSDGIVALSNFIVSAVAGIATRVPGIFMKTIITIIATVFLTIDFEKVSEFLLRQLPKKQKAILYEAKGYFGGTLLRCIASYVLIFAVTFVELWIGLALIKIPHAMMIAMLIALLDILPILGTGSVLIPWGIIALLNGDFKMGIGIFVLYLVITVIRNIIEPKLVGKQVGLHPVVTLAGMLLGLRFAGFIGMLGVPFLLAFLKKLNDKGMIRLIR